MNKLLSSWVTVYLLLLATTLSACRANQADERHDVEADVNDSLHNANLGDVRADWREDQRELRLTGEVETAEQRVRAEELALEVVGTTGRIINDVKIEGADTESMDGRIEERLQAMLDDSTVWGPSDFDLRDVDVDVEAGVVMIAGTVESQEIKDRIEERARNIDGVRQVVSSLAVEREARGQR